MPSSLHRLRKTALCRLRIDSLHRLRETALCRLQRLHILPAEFSPKHPLLVYVPGAVYFLLCVLYGNHAVPVLP